MSSYTTGVPLTAQSLGQTRDTIKDNFTIIDTVFQEDHEDFDDSNKGKHKQSRYRSITGGPTTVSGEATHYSEDDGNGDPQIFFRPQSVSSGGVKYQMTAYSNSNIATFGNAVDPSDYSSEFSAWTFLPGGLIMMYGFAISSSSATKTVSLPFALPNSSVILKVNVIPTSSRTLFVETGTITTSQFVVSGLPGAATASFFWDAIGF